MRVRDSRCLSSRTGTTAKCVGVRWDAWGSLRTLALFITDKGFNVSQSKPQHKLILGAMLVASVFTTSVWAQTSTAPAAPAAREEVKSDGRAAAATGQTPKGEAGVTRDGKGSVTAIPKPKGSRETREEVRAEAREANKSGDIAKGEAGQTENQAKRQGKTRNKSEKSRAEVRSDAATPDPRIPKGEGSAPMRPGAPR